MSDWLTAPIPVGPAPSPWLLAWRVGAALGLGVAVAGIYRWARRGESVAPTFLATLVLLSTLIAMATQIIGDNVARAFSLVGALSVVRFRTVVKDTQDTAFVIFAVVVGMSSGADHLGVGVIGLLTIGAAAVFLWPPGTRGGWASADGALTFRLVLGDDRQNEAERVIAAAASRFELTEVGTAKQGVALDLTYRLRLRPGSSPVALVAALKRVPGVEGVDLKRFD